MQETGKEAVTSLGHKLLITRRNPEFAKLEALPLIPNGKLSASGSKLDGRSSETTDKSDQTGHSFDAEYDDADAYGDTPSVDTQTIEATERDVELADDPLVENDPRDARVDKQNDGRSVRDDQLGYATLTVGVTPKGDQIEEAVQKPFVQTVSGRRAIEQSEIAEAKPTVRTETTAVNETSNPSFEVAVPTRGSGKETITAQSRDIPNAIKTGAASAQQKDARTELAMQVDPPASGALDGEKPSVPKPDVRGPVARYGITSVSNAVETAVVTNMGKEDLGFDFKQPPADELVLMKQNANKQIKLAPAPPITDATSGPSVAIGTQPAEAEPTLSSIFDAETAPLRDSRPVNSVAQLTPFQTAMRPETPGMIGRQMVEALQRLPDRPVEITLNPSELGRVRMSISAAEAGIVVSLVVERPETTDLMRRHIDDLATEFADLGYENIEFSFSDHQDTSAERDGDHSETAVEISYSDPQDIVTSVRPEATLVTGLDLRL